MIYASVVSKFKPKFPESPKDLGPCVIELSLKARIAEGGLTETVPGPRSNYKERKITKLSLFADYEIHQPKQEEEVDDINKPD